MTLLSICQAVADESGFERPTNIIGSNNPISRQLLALCNREGKYLASKSHPLGGWTVLQIEHLFDTADGVAEYAFPSDFSCFINDTQWSRSEHIWLYGPVSPQEWQTMKSGVLGTGVFSKRFRVKRASSGNTDKFVVDPTPTDVATFVFEYISKNWVNSAGTTYASWQADTDTSLLDEELIKMGLMWRFKKEKGLDWQADYSEYELQVNKAVARDGGRSKLDMAYPGLRIRYIDRSNIPDTFQGG